MVVAALPAATPGLLLAATAASLAGYRSWAHAARAAALGASLATAWLVRSSSPLTLNLFSWIELGDLRIDAGVFGDGQTAALLVLLSLWAVIAPLVSGKPEGRVGAAMDLAAAGAALAIVADGAWLTLVGCEVLLAGAFLHAARSSSASASRRVLFHTRLGTVALAGTLVFADSAAAPWSALLTAAVLVGAWPLHSWLEDLGEGGTSIRLAAALTGVCLLLRFADGLPVAVAAVFILSSVLSVSAAMATQDLFRAQMLTAAAQGSLVLAAATVEPVAALLLLAAHGTTQVTHAVGLGRIAAALPTVPRRFTDLGGLAAALPWPRWLVLGGTLAACVSAPALWGHAALAGRGLAEAGPPGAAVVALLFVLPCLPLARMALAPFGGPTRHTTTSATPDVRGPRLAALAALVVAAWLPAGVAWMVTPTPPTTAAAFAAGAGVVIPLAGFLLWRKGPRGSGIMESPLRMLMADGFGVSRILTACAAAAEATGRFVWTAIDGVLAGGVPVLLNLGVRAAGWLLARLHDGLSGWAVATVVGTVGILLWSLGARGSAW